MVRISDDDDYKLISEDGKMRECHILKWEGETENEGRGGVLGFRRTKRIGKNHLKYLLEDHNKYSVVT